MNNKSSSKKSKKTNGEGGEVGEGGDGGEVINKMADINQYLIDIENTTFISDQKKYLSKIMNTESCFSKKVIENIADIIIPTIQNIDNLFIYNYNITHLKIFSKYYKLKTVGNKNQLLKHLYCHILLSVKANVIQKTFRGFLQRVYNKLHGPAWLKRDLCNNTHDFLTFDTFNEISHDQFFSYKDIDNFIYGFDIRSIYNLIYTMKQNPTIYVMNKEKDIKNPYNRNQIPETVITDIKKILRINKFLNNIPTNSNTPIKKNNKQSSSSSMSSSSSSSSSSINNIMNTNTNKIITNVSATTEDNITAQKLMELKVLDVFQHINFLGNYSDQSWFLQLTRSRLLCFLNELIEIWNYRAGISDETKRAICPPVGNPFRNVYLIQSQHSHNDINKIRSTIIDILHTMVFSGIDTDSQILGSYYILTSLTLVSENAATALPWLYNSVVIS